MNTSFVQYLLLAIGALVGFSRRCASRPHVPQRYIFHTVAAIAIRTGILRFSILIYKAFDIQVIEPAVGTAVGLGAGRDDPLQDSLLAGMSHAVMVKDAFLRHAFHVAIVAAEEFPLARMHDAHVSISVLVRAEDLVAMLTRILFRLEILFLSGAFSHAASSFRHPRFREVFIVHQFRGERSVHPRVVSLQMPEDGFSVVNLVFTVVTRKLQSLRGVKRFDVLG